MVFHQMEMHISGSSDQEENLAKMSAIFLQDGAGLVVPKKTVWFWTDANLDRDLLFKSILLQ